MTSPPTSLRPTGFLPTGTLAVGGGLLVLGASAYGFLAVSARTLGPERFAPLSVLWVIVYTAGPGLFLPLEQETGRALSARRVQRLGGRPVLLRTAAIGLVVVAVVSAATLAAAPAIVRPLFDGNSAMVAGLLLSLVGLWAAHVSRGALAGTGRFGRYGAQLALEGGLRLVGSVLFAVLAVRSSAPFALLVGAAPGLAVLLVVRSPRGLAEPGPPARWSEISGALGLLLTGSLLAQGLVNAGPVLVKLLATDAERAAAGQFLAGLIVARVPLFLFTAVQAALLPRLAALATAGRRAEFLAGVARMCGLVAALGVLSCAGALLVGPEVVRAFFGAGFALGRTDLLCLTLASTAYMAAVVLGQALIALQRPGAVAVGWGVGVGALGVVTALVGGLFPRVELGFLAGATAAAVALAALLARRLAQPPDSAEGTQPAGRQGSPGSANASRRASRQSGIGVRPAARQAASDSTLYAGRGAGRGNAAVVVGSTRAGSAPSSSKIAWVKPYQVVCPPPVQW